MLKKIWQAIRAWAYIRTSPLMVDEIIWHRGEMIVKTCKPVWYWHKKSSTAMSNLDHMKIYIDERIDGCK